MSPSDQAAVLKNACHRVDDAYLTGIYGETYRKYPD